MEQDVLELPGIVRFRQTDTKTGRFHTGYLKISLGMDAYMEVAARSFGRAFFCAGISVQNNRYIVATQTRPKG